MRQAVQPQERRGHAGGVGGEGAAKAADVSGFQAVTATQLSASSAHSPEGRCCPAQSANSLVALIGQLLSNGKRADAPANRDNH